MGNKTSASKYAPEDKVALFTQFQLEVLKAHNKYRSKHGVPELHLTKELCDAADTIASACLANRQMIDSPTFGESIFWVYAVNDSSAPSVEEVVKSWYFKITDHQFKSPCNSSDHCQCSPVVWKSTLNMGIAIATDNKERSYVVVNYIPPGNVGSFSFDF